MENTSQIEKVTGPRLAERTIWAALGALHELDVFTHRTIDWLLGIADALRRGRS